MIKSRRYCLTCKKITTFKLRNRKLLKHSICGECGNTKAVSPKYAKEKGLIKQGGK